MVKMYGMVDDPAMDAVVAWGAASNSFVVADPFAFSRALLPAHFKHSNFSSFIRQLNTYGFRKVDPDKWEFAHMFFLRGQMHLLPQIVWRRSSSGGKLKDDVGAARSCGTDNNDEDSSTMMAMEVILPRQEQKAIEETMTVMWRQVQDTERRPKQMLAFLLKVVHQDPKVMCRLVGNSGNSSNHGSFPDGPDESTKVKRQRLPLDMGVQVGKGMFADGGLLYDDINLEEALVTEPSVNFNRFYAGFYDMQVQGGAGNPPYGFPMNIDH